MSQSINIGFVKRQDKPCVLQLAKQDHAESAFSSMAFSPTKFDSIFNKVLDRVAIGLLARIDEKPVGFIYVTLGEYFASDAKPIATVNVLYVAREIRHSLVGGKVALKLIRAVQKIAQDQKATHLLFHVTSGINIAKSDRFFRKLGATTLGGNYLFKI